MKAVIIGTTVIGLGSVVAAVWVGSLTADEVVVEDPYERGLEHDAHKREGAALGINCHADRGVCTQHVAGKGRVELEISPRPVRTLTDLRFTVTLEPAVNGGGDASIDLTMPGMYMGHNRVRLEPQGGGVFRGRGSIVRCPSGGKKWRAEVSLTGTEGTAPEGAVFVFLVDQR